MRSRKGYPIVLFAVSFSLTCAIAIASAAKEASAKDEFKVLQTDLKNARASHDWHSSLLAATRLKEFVNGAPNGLLEVARGALLDGNPNAAIDALAQYARLGEAADVLAMSPDFSPLATNPGWQGIADEMKRNRVPVSLAKTAFTIEDSGLLVEDVDYDDRGKRFYFTSIEKTKIVATDVRGMSADFAKSPDDWPMVAIKVDSRHGVVWSTEAAFQGFDRIAKSDWGRSALLCYSLEGGKLLKRIEGPRPSSLGDMTLTEQGDVIVSDGEGGGIYRLPRGGSELQRIDAGDFISPQTPTMHPDGKRVYVPDYVRGIGILDLASKRVQWLSTKERYAISGIDGLYFHAGRLIAVQNGTSPERVVAFTLDTPGTQIVSEEIIERATQTLGDPTHAVWVGDDLYYIANSGWDVIDEHGSLKKGQTPPATRLMRFSHR